MTEGSQSKQLPSLGVVLQSAGGRDTSPWTATLPLTTHPGSLQA